jgi:hypothetical protein
MKIGNANNDIIIEYIKFILLVKEQIINEIENKIDYLKNP